jgi:hypothetical protein
MTPHGRAVIPAFQRELDPLLLLPIRLFVVCLLADARWCEDVAVRDAMHVTEHSFAPHVARLHAAGYLEIRAEGRRTKLRLTTLGLDRLTEHVTALQRVASTAAELVAAHSVARTRPDSL